MDLEKVKLETPDCPDAVSSKTETEVEVKQKEERTNETCLLFLGTFDHEDSKDVNSDLVQLKENSRITEIRIIPLGAEVSLGPNGSFQLGATNPAELYLEFYYNDLQHSTKPTFSMLEIFKYCEKSQIQLNCSDKEPEILTDAILIRGHYATVTLALYGYSIGDEEIKQIEVLTDETVSVPLDISGSRSPETIENVDFSISPIMVKDEGETSPVIKSEAISMPIPELPSPPTPVKQQQPSPIRTLTIDVPQAIPTITTRVNFSPIKIFPQSEPMDLEPGDVTAKVEAVSSDEEPFDEQGLTGESNDQELLPLLMETEDISDGEISDTAEDFKFQSDSIRDLKSTINNEFIESSQKQRKQVSREKAVGVRSSTDKEESFSTPGKNSTSQPGSPHELLSDQDSFGDDFADPAVEEIISDEEMPDYGDDEYNEWDDVWPQKIGRGFNPFLDTYEVQHLRSQKIELYLRKSVNEDKFAASKLLGAISEFDSLNDAVIDSWVEKMEQLLPFLHQALNAIGEEDQEVLKSVRFWVRTGLDLEFVKNQASIKFKIRHIKVGLKLVHCVCNYGGFIAEELLKLEFEGNRSLQHKLLDVLMDNELRTIISTQTLILKSLDATLSTRLGFRLFSVSVNEKGVSGFQRLVDYFLDTSSTTRVSYAFRTFLNKVTFMSNIQAMEQIVQTVVHDENDEPGSPKGSIISSLGHNISAQCSAILEQLCGTAHRIEQALAFPVRVLPADTVIELPPVGPGHDPKLNFIRLLRETGLMKICSALLTFKEANEFVTPICDLILCLLGWEEGLVYLCSEAEFTTLVIKALLRWEEKRGVALHFAHCLEIMRSMDVLGVELERNVVDDKDEDIQCLQQIYSFLVTSVGREALRRTLSIGNLIGPLLKCVRDADSRTVNNTEKLSRLVKSARKGYALDIVIFVVKFTDDFEFLRIHGSEIYELITSVSDHYEGSDKLNELLPFLKPTLDKVHFTYDGIESLCHLIKGKLTDFLVTPTTQEQNWGFTPEIVTVLRILCHFAGSLDHDDITTVLQRSEEAQSSKQLKYMMAYVRMNNEDVLSDFITILNRIFKDFEHVAVQTYLLAGSKGDALLSLLLPLVCLFRKILTRTIEVRNTEFRDLTPVPVLLQAYSLLKSFPENSLSHNKAIEIEVHIINTLLAYTIPTMKLGEESEEELTKSVWTAMINEIIKFVWTGPASFIPGISMLSELLPFPFPIQTNTKLSDDDKDEWVRQKRLWSAYLHGASSQIQELIEFLCESAHPELLSALKQFCLKLADLSGSSCLVVCRAVMNQVMASIEMDFGSNSPPRTYDSAVPTSSVKAWVECATESRILHCSVRTSRLLEFLASLISSHGLFKAGVMQVYRALTKMDEKFAEFVCLLCTILTSCPTKDLSAHAQGQRHIVTIFQALCDVEFNLFLSGSDIGHLENQPTPDYIRTNSLPQKETLTLICSAFLSYLNSFDLNVIALKALVAENVFHALQIISETEYGFYHLRIALDKKSESLNNFTNKLARPLQDESAISPMVEIVAAFVNFLNCLVTPKEDAENCLSIRQNTLSMPELSKVLSWVAQNTITKKEEQPSEEAVDVSEIKTELEQSRSGVGDSQNNKPGPLHPLLQVKAELEKWMAKIDENQETYQIYASLEGSLETLNKLLESIDKRGIASPSVPVEVLLAPPDPFIKAFAHRPISVLLEDRILLSSSYITSLPATFYEEMETCSDSELIKCDLIDMTQAVVPGLDLMKELESFFKRTLPSNLSELRNPIEVVDLKVKTCIEFPYSHEGGMNTGLLGLSPRKPSYNSGMRGNSSRGGYGRGMNSGAGRPGPHGFDPFRSRPPNTSRPPSLHVDDFVALESSGQGSGGQSNFNKPGPRTGIGRGARGSNSGRPFNNMDRGRTYRPPQSGSTYYNRNDGGQMNSGRGRGRGRGYGGGGNPRWGNSDTHSQNQGFGSGRPMRANSGGRQSFSRHPYRDSPMSGRTPGSNNPSMNTSSSLRWRDRRPFNR